MIDLTQRLQDDDQAEREHLLDRLAELGREKDLLAGQLHLWREYAGRLEASLRSLRLALGSRCPGCGKTPEPWAEGDPRPSFSLACRRCWRADRRARRKR